MRPQSIELFEKVYLGAIAIGLVNTFLSWSQVDAMLADPRLRAAGVTSGTLMVGLVIGTIIPLLLWYFVARRASNVAKWLYIALTALGVWGLLGALANPLAPKGLATVLGGVAVGLQLYAAWLLFRPDAAAWLESRGADGPGDPSTFD